MDFLSEFGKRFSNVARSVADKGRDNPEAARLNDELRAAGEALERLFADYGRVCYTAGNLEAGADLAARIRAGMARVEALSACRDDLQAGRRCAACGTFQPRSARFCANCGKRLADTAAAPEPEADAGAFCPRCGAAMTPDRRFCPVCGADREGGADALPPAFEADAAALEGIDVEEPARDVEE